MKDIRLKLYSDKVNPSFLFYLLIIKKKKPRRKEIDECLSNMKAIIHTLSTWMNDQFSSLFFFITRGKYKLNC